MLSDTGLYATRPSRFEEFENSKDFLSYAPISDLSLSSSTSTLPDLSNQMSDSFLNYFANSEISGCLDDWKSQATLPALDTTSWASPSLKNTNNLQSPFESPVMDWSSPTSCNASDGGFSSIQGSSKHSSMSFEDDFYPDFLSKPVQNTNEPKTITALPKIQTPPKLCSPSLETETPNFSQEEIAKLWATAFPGNQIPTTASQPERTNPIKTQSPSTLHQKRKSVSQSPSLTFGLSPSSSKKRHIEEKEPRRYSKRTNSTASTTASTNARLTKGSKVNHNLIEKRYRTSLNQKIALLRDALPRSYNNGNGNSCNSSDDDETFVKREDQEEFDGQLADGKQTTKGAVLSDAAKYIRFLEGKVSRLEERLSCVQVF